VTAQAISQEGSPFQSATDSGSGREKRERQSGSSDRAERIQSQGPAASPGQARAMPVAGKVGYVSEIFTRTLESLERLQQQSPNRIQLNFKSESGDDMKVLLKYANGMLQSTFVTDSDSVRSAIRESWAQFQRQLADRGVDAQLPDFRHNPGDSRSGSRGHRDPDDTGSFFTARHSTDRSPVSRSATSPDRAGAAPFPEDGQPGRARLSAWA
jgi:hypothetical protein